jgi:hypothetical protein
VAVCFLNTMAAGCLYDLLSFFTVLLLIITALPLYFLFVSLVFTLPCAWRCVCVRVMKRVATTVSSSSKARQQRITSCTLFHFSFCFWFLFMSESPGALRSLFLSFVSAPSCYGIQHYLKQTNKQVNVDCDATCCSLAQRRFSVVFNSLNVPHT